MHILIADDESIIRTGAKRTLEQACPGSTIHLAAHAEEAARLLVEHPIDIVLTDILMPGMDGLEFMRISRRKHPGSSGSSSPRIPNLRTLRRRYSWGRRIIC